MKYDLRKTLVRALVEGAVIFVGILGALFANSWWDTREARERERSYVVSLSEDFDENQIRLRRAIESAELVKAAALELLAIETSAQGRELGTDSLTALLRGLQALPTFEPVTKTYDNILGAGDLLTLRSGDLRSSLADFQSRLLLMNVVQETQERQLVEIFQPYIIEHLDYLAIVQLDSDSVTLPEPIHSESVQSVVGTREFRNWVVTRLDWADDLQDQHTTVLGRVEKIQAILRRPTA
jgi:hypothetical protein